MPAQGGQVIETATAGLFAIASLLLYITLPLITKIFDHLQWKPLSIQCPEYVREVVPNWVAESVKRTTRRILVLIFASCDFTATILVGATLHSWRSSESGEPSGEGSEGSGEGSLHLLVDKGLIISGATLIEVLKSTLHMDLD